MADFINTIDLLGDEVVAGMLVEDTLTEFNDDTLLTIPRNPLGYSTSLVSVNLPNVTSLDGYAFYQAKGLTHLNLPALSSVQGDSQFRNTNITTSDNINIPNLKTLTKYMFAENGMTKCVFPNVETVDEIFGSGDPYSLTLARFDNATTLGENVFDNKQAVREIILPKVQSIGRMAFSRMVLNSPNFVDIYLPATPPVIGANLFYSTPPERCAIHIPPGSFANYVNATNWSDLMDYDFEEDSPY